MDQIPEQNPNCNQEERERQHLLAALRSVNAKMRASLTEIDAVGIALKYGFIDVGGALAWLERIGAMSLFDVSEPQRA